MDERAKGDAGPLDPLGLLPKLDMLGPLGRVARKALEGPLGLQGAHSAGVKGHLGPPGDEDTIYVRDLSSAPMTDPYLMVTMFQNHMRARMKANEWRGGWSACTDQDLVSYLASATENLIHLLVEHRMDTGGDDIDGVVQQVVDVANYGAMILERRLYFKQSRDQVALAELAGGGLPPLSIPSAVDVRADPTVGEPIPAPIALEIPADYDASRIDSGGWGPEPGACRACDGSGVSEDGEACPMCVMI